MTMKPGQFETRDPTAVMMRKMKNDDMYAMLRPTVPISLIGEKINGPTPFVPISFVAV